MTPTNVAQGHQLKMMQRYCTQKFPWGGQTCNLDQICRYHSENRRCIKVLPDVKEDLRYSRHNLEQELVSL